MGMPVELPTDKEFRDAGFTTAAKAFPRSDRQFLMICAFNGCKPEDVSRAWRYFPNASCKAAWERVEKVLAGE